MVGRDQAGRCRIDGIGLCRLCSALQRLRTLGKTEAPQERALAHRAMGRDAGRRGECSKIDMGAEIGLAGTVENVCPLMAAHRLQRGRAAGTLQPVVDDERPSAVAGDAGPDGAGQRPTGFAELRFGAFAGIGGAFLSLYYPGSWNEGLSSGQGLMAVALVIFARWDPLRCLWASLLFGAAGAISPALQSVGVTQGYYLFSAAPYVLTLVLMIASCSPEHSVRGAPGELGAVK